MATAQLEQHGMRRPNLTLVEALDEFVPRPRAPRFAVVNLDDTYRRTHRGRVTEADLAREEMRLATTYRSSDVPPGLVCSARLA